MLAFLTGRRQDPPKPGTPTDQSPAPEPAVRIRFRTRGGAEVHVLDDNTFRCQGCDHEDNVNRSITSARRDANGHAEGCWSMPKPTPDA